MGIKNILKWLFVTNLGRLLLAFLWVIIFIGLDNFAWEHYKGYTGWLMWVANIGIAYLFGFTILAIIYAWIINPIRNWKEKRKK